MPNRGKFIGNDNLYVPDAPTIGDASTGNTEVSVAFTAPSDVGNDDITSFAARVTDGTNVFNGTASSSPITVTGLSNGTSYTAQVWAINDYGNGPLSAATASFSPALGRGIFGGGRVSSRVNTIDYVSIASTGDAQDFGDLTLARQISPSLISSSTRTVFAAGLSASVTYAITIDYVTLASTGNATDFGDLSVGRYNAAACSNDVRGIHFNGDQQSGTDNTIDYITIASTGNATDFADMNITTNSGGASSSPTRGVRFGGGSSNEISYITIASAGAATDFGNLTVARYNVAGASSNTRVCMAGGEGDSKSNVIDYITTASTGNASDFGDLNNSLQGAGGTSNGVRGLFAGGEASGLINVIDFITIANTGNATDFGDLTQARHSMSCGSDGHGGIDTTALSAFAPAAMGLQMGGRLGYPGETHIGYVDIATTSNTISFGDLTTPRSQASGSASSTRAVSYTGYGEANGTTISNIIDFVAFSTKGKATDFGDSTAAAYFGASVSNGSRGVAALGYSGGFVNNIDYITFASAGNGTDFGDLTAARGGMAGGMNSTTRGLFAGGFQSGQNIIDYVTIASTGNATDFGDLLNVVSKVAGGGSSTRGIVGGGYDNASSAEVNVIQYVTIASTGNATDFGDLTDARHTYGGMSSSTRMIFGSDNRASGSSDVLDYVTIASTGNATDFGDGLIGIESAYTSNSHGGIA